MKKNCDFYMDKFFALDKNERLPASLTVHLFFCRNCRNFVRKFSLLEKKCSKENMKKISCDSRNVVEIMRRLDSAYEMYNLQKERVSMRQWLVAGATLVLCMVLFEMLAFFASAEFFIFPLSLFFAFSIIMYCVAFVGTNMDFFIKKWKIQ